ncbi:MAG: carbohydrate ABC transporter permease [candidate division NC10 bacterium]|nr:carbohydrate ABC transporter permease [candidate division NC10 bacterium]MBI2115415.1 carbohydrate ABC transporter permease [candidate division NC10 bacterium]
MRLRGSAVAILVGLLLVYFLLPLYHLVTMSVKTDVQTFASPPVWIFQPVWDHYRVLLRGKFPGFLANSLLVSAGSVLVTMALGTPAAFTLARARFRGRRVLLLAILGTRMLPPISLALPVFLAYLRLGLLDNRLGLVLVFLTFNLPLVVWLLKGFFDEVPDSLLEAARMDGCSILGAFVRIAVPYTSPGILACTILAWIYAWNEFTFTLILARRDAITATVALASFFDLEKVAWGSIAAGSTMTMLPVVLFSLLGRRFLIRGLTGGALKE